MTTGATERTHPRERLLDTAGRLFYAQGIQAVGVEQLVTEAGVTRATFYRHFSSKDGLVVAYLEARGARVEEAVAAILAAHRGRAALLALMDMIGDNLCQPGFRGCGFLNAAAEFPDPAHPARVHIAEHRGWFHGVLRTVVRDAGHPDPERVARTLVLLRDGAMVGGALDDPRAIRATLREAAENLLAS
ncbi:MULTISPECIES: TetR/AcrR family transcriptional regulator [Streptomyces]|uniref:TetR/AcrR family transcriptional regulator n=1 Tax=Streptomyces TaxID=1883 RepID=UPI001962CEEE|nr:MULTISPECIES: TetR/AcrR family transcriptional regulator [Streptomyces]QRX92389.1 TetR/AcrR family transcriptional regulator [Streptomyces noursei]UJB42117.1 TetR/AcrR family transcriptional regulator [Streptomyces sp. A1-5]